MLVAVVVPPINNNDQPFDAPVPILTLIVSLKSFPFTDANVASPPISISDDQFDKIIALSFPVELLLDKIDTEPSHDKEKL